jgi:hypothetical protein
MIGTIDDAIAEGDLEDPLARCEARASRCRDTRREGEQHNPNRYECADCPRTQGSA